VLVEQLQVVRDLLLLFYYKIFWAVFGVSNTPRLSFAILTSNLATAGALTLFPYSSITVKMYPKNEGILDQGY
jgi:hypothetical protein